MQRILCGSWSNAFFSSLAEMRGFMYFWTIPFPDSSSEGKNPLLHIELIVRICLVGINLLENTNQSFSEAGMTSVITPEARFRVRVSGSENQSNISYHQAFAAFLT